MRRTRLVLIGLTISGLAASLWFFAPRQRGAQQTHKALRDEVVAPAQAAELVPAETTPVEEPSAPRRPAVAEATPETDEHGVVSEREEPVQGLLLDAESGAPLPGYRLELRPAMQSPAGLVTTDAEGRFELSLLGADLSGRSIYIRHEPDPAHPQRRVLRRLDPPNFVFRDQDAAALVFRAHSPEHLLEVEIVDAAGRPQAGAFGVLAQRLSAGDYPRLYQARADAQGIALLSIWERELAIQAVLCASTESGRSGPLDLETPISLERRRLVIEPSAALALRVWTPGGETLAGARTTLRLPDHPLFLLVQGNFLERTDAGGEVHHKGLAPGDYLLSVENSYLRRWQETEVVLEAGRETRLDLVLETGAFQLAVAGQVVDENGDALRTHPLALRYADGHTERVFSDESGHFEAWWKPVDLVQVTADGYVNGGDFAPSAVEAAFGRDDLLFRRTAAVEETHLRVEAFDARTDEPIPAFDVSFDLGPELASGANTWTTSRGFCDVRCLVRDEVRWRVLATGYQYAEGRLLDQARSLEQESLLRVRLERGLRLRVRVLDGDTEKPVADARFERTDHAPVLTDAAGWAWIEAADWGAYRVSKTGYEAQDWDPADDTLHFSGLYLNPR